MAILTVNGVPVPPPSELKVDIFDVASSADRSAAGTAVIDRVGVKRKLELKWYHLTAEALASLLNAVGEALFFTVTYPDPLTPGRREMICYTGDRAVGIARMEGGEPVWTQLTMNWIER